MGHQRGKTSRDLRPLQGKSCTVGRVKVDSQANRQVDDIWMLDRTSWRMRRWKARSPVRVFLVDLQLQRKFQSRRLRHRGSSMFARRPRWHKANLTSSTTEGANIRKGLRSGVKRAFFWSPLWEFSFAQILFESWDQVMLTAAVPALPRCLSLGKLQQVCCLFVFQ